MMRRVQGEAEYKNVGNHPSSVFVRKMMRRVQGEAEYKNVGNHPSSVFVRKMMRRVQGEAEYKNVGNHPSSVLVFLPARKTSPQLQDAAAESMTSNGFEKIKSLQHIFRFPYGISISIWN